MKKFTRNDIIRTNGIFTVNGVDGKPYSFKVIVVLKGEEEYSWCIAQPNMKMPKDIDPESSVLFKVYKNPKDNTQEVVELVDYDDSIVDEVFDGYNALVDEIRENAKK